MSIKSKVLSAAAALTLLSGAGTASVLTAGAANAATPSCDNFLLDVFRQGARVGQPIILFRASNTDPALDFTRDITANVGVLANVGLVSPLTALHYANLTGIELEYAPFGVESGLCVGTATTPFNGDPVSLQPCGVSGKTIWIEDANDVPGCLDPTTGLPLCNLFNNGFLPLISGANTNFSHPQVLNYPQNGFPTDLPRPQLTTHSLQKFATGAIFENQLWAAFLGQA